MSLSSTSHHHHPSLNDFLVIKTCLQVTDNNKLSNPLETRATISEDKCLKSDYKLTQELFKERQYSKIGKLLIQVMEKVQLCAKDRINSCSENTMLRLAIENSKNLYKI